MVQISIKIIEKGWNDWLRVKELICEVCEVCPVLSLADERKWLGGLKSFHSVFGEPHTEDGKVYISASHIEKGMLDQKYKLRAEKEL